MLAGVWQRIHEANLQGLREHDKIMWDRACVDAASVPARAGGEHMGRTRPIVANSAANIICWWMSAGFHW
jgi:hypothetical protein